MEKSNVNAFPLWKWIVELILGIIVFVVLYGIACGLLAIPQPIAKGVAFLFSAVLICALFLLWTRLFEKQWRWDILINGICRNIVRGILIGFAYFVILIGLLYVTGCYSAQYASPHWLYIISNLCFCFLVACGEEVIFRGILFRMIDERFGLWWALGISALIFGLVHIINPNASIWSSIAIAIEAGVLLGAVYKYSNSLCLPIGIHWVWNFTEGNIFGCSISGGDAEESIFTANLAGPDFITGGSFGPEASVIALIMGTILSAFFLWKYSKKQSNTNLTSKRFSRI